MTSDIAALIALLEESKEGSRELDIAIAKAMYPETTYDAAEDKWYLHGFHVRIEEYTRSLDSALSLVPEGWRAVEVHQLPQSWKWRLEKFQDWGRTAGYISAESRYVPTPALALVIAALKARATDKAREERNG
jgi:hypothetical protein